VTLDKLEPVSCRLQIELVIFWNQIEIFNASGYDKCCHWAHNLFSEFF
jgi:hypothetical protein